MVRVEDFSVRERNVLTLPQAVREASHLDAGTQGKAIAVQEGVVVLITDPLLVDDLVAHLREWLEERTARDPWARLNEALTADRLEPVPTERYVAPSEPDTIPDTDRIVQEYADDARIVPSERRWQN
ncbi:MAG TPA: hypothetical protein VMW65_01015 [Chloroflexota bacterium]|nr:hypothetical protein [Chloroflexota bacterium]